MTVISAVSPSPAVLYGVHLNTPSCPLTLAELAPIVTTPLLPPDWSTPSLVHLNDAGGLPWSLMVHVRSVLGFSPSISGPIVGYVAVAPPGHP